MPFSYVLPAAEAYQGLAFLDPISEHSAQGLPEMELLRDETVLIQGLWTACSGITAALSCLIIRPTGCWSIAAA